MQKLSIGIPTYNREKQLENQLKSILQQDLSNLEEIIVVDNNSDYDIESLIRTFDCSKIRLVRNAFNIKMSTNMQMPFLYCKTEWLWLLSDDDEVLPNSINTVINQIENNPENTGMIKFAIDRPSSIQKESIAYSLEEFIDYYYNEKPIRKGDLVFISTNLYNTSKLKKYLGSAFEFSYTYIGFLVPVFFGLNSKEISVIFSSKSVVKYLPPREGNYSFGTVGKGLSTLSHLPLNISKEYRKKFLDVTMSISYISLMKLCLMNKNKSALDDFRIIYNDIYRYYLPFMKKIFIKLFFVFASNLAGRFFLYSSSDFLKKIKAR